MFLRYVLFGLFISALSAMVALSYTYCYSALLFDFSKTLPFWKILSIFCFLGLLFAGIYYLVAEKSYRLILPLNIALAIGSLTSILWPITASIDEEFPEMFPSFAIPLHFIFPLFWLASFPTFNKRLHD